MTYPRKNKKVILGLSGGVDSTAAALLLKERGYDVTGLFFDIKGSPAGERTKERKRAERAAEQLGIRLILEDVSRLFEKAVIEPFCRDYLNGRTPNPCIVCNPAVKFRTLMEAADREGAYYIATGHYADTFFHGEKGMWYVKRAASDKKDQSYMLYRLEQSVISRLILPLSMAENKKEARHIARTNLMDNWGEKDSQEICFIEKGRDYRDFLEERGIVFPPGDFVDTGGNILGTHRGIGGYTIGQRKGLGIALGRPAFVVRIDPVENKVVLGDSGELFFTKILSENNIIEGIKGASLEERGLNGISVKAKIRYAAPPAEAVIRDAGDGRIETVFSRPQRAATPGQSVVFYKDDLVLGGGFICHD